VLHIKVIISVGGGVTDLGSNTGIWKQ